MTTTIHVTTTDGAGRLLKRHGHYAASSHITRSDMPGRSHEDWLDTVYQAVIDNEATGNEAVVIDGLTVRLASQPLPVFDYTAAYHADLTTVFPWWIDRASR